MIPAITSYTLHSSTHTHTAGQTQIHTPWFTHTWKNTTSSDLFSIMHVLYLKTRSPAVFINWKILSEEFLLKLKLTQTHKTPTYIYLSVHMTLNTSCPLLLELVLYKKLNTLCFPEKLDLFPVWCPTPKWHKGCTVCDTCSSVKCCEEQEASLFLLHP